MHELPLQLLLREHPEWIEQPVVVVSADRSQGTVLQLNELARSRGIRPGMRYGQALGLDHALRAGVVPQAACDAAQQQLIKLLLLCSPIVEPKSDEPGIVWLDGGGLGQLFASASAWAAAIAEHVHRGNWQASVVVGFGRFACYAAARARSGGAPQVFRHPREQDACVHGIELSSLLRHPQQLQRLEQLGLRSLGDLMRLPLSSVRERIGEQAAQLRKLLEGDADAPLQATDIREPLRCRIALEPPGEDRTALLFRVRSALSALLARLAHRGSAVVSMDVVLLPDCGEPIAPLQLQTAEPTREERVLVDLIRLKLEALQLAVPLRALDLTLQDVPLPPAQDALMSVRPRRDTRAANQALARLRSELGPQAVRLMQVREGHLPEACWGWEPAQLAQIAVRAADPRPPLPRRMQLRPRQRAAPQPTQLAEPQVVAGGWWHRPIERVYYLYREPEGQLLWWYYDAVRGSWFEHAGLA